MSERDAVPGHDSPASRPLERRAFVRLTSSLSAACRPTGRPALEPGWLGTVRDVSRGGVGLLLQHRFERGTFLTVELRQSTGEVVRTAQVRVMHATAVRTGGTLCWLLGCAFDQPLSEEDFQALL
jgi:hypothetical protein